MNHEKMLYFSCECCSFYWLDLIVQASLSFMMSYGVFRANQLKRCVALKSLNCVTCMPIAMLGMQTDHMHIPWFIWAEIMLKSCFLAGNICGQLNCFCVYTFTMHCDISFIKSLAVVIIIVTNFCVLSYCPCPLWIIYRECSRDIGEGTSLSCNVHQCEPQGSKKKNDSSHVSQS